MKARIQLTKEDVKAFERVAKVFETISTIYEETAVSSIDVETPQHKVIEYVYFDNYSRIDEIQNFFKQVLDKHPNL